MAGEEPVTLCLRINFYLLRTFCPHLGSFCVVSSFTTFRPNFTSGLLQVIYKMIPTDLTDKMKRSFFQAAVVSILLYGCTTWTLTKQLEKKLDGNYTRMLRAILNKSWRPHPNYTATSLPSRKLYKLDEPDMQDTAGEARTSL